MTDDLPARVMPVIYDLAREALVQRDRVIAGGWAIAGMPHEMEVRAWLALTPTASATESDAGSASSPEAKTTTTDAGSPR